ncbi:NfeD family protein, partial [Planctomycetota bacterium]
MWILAAFGLLLIGLFLIMMDFIIPTAGLMSITGVMAIFGAIYLAFQEFGALGAVLFTAGALAAIPFIIKFGLKRLSMDKVLSSEDGYVGVADKSNLLGRKGTAFTDLRPSGTADIGDERVDVVAETSLIEKNTHIEVIKVEGNR